MVPPSAGSQRGRLLEETVTVYISEHSSWLQGLSRKYHEEGFAEGQERGRAEGRAEGEAVSVLSVLRFRGIEVPAARERQIRACTDLAQLKVWLERAVHATHIDDLFDDAPGAEPGPGTNAAHRAFASDQRDELMGDRQGLRPMPQ